MADVPAAVLDSEEKGEPEGAQVANDAEEPSQESWTPYRRILLPEREINFQFTEATLFGFSITHSQIHF